MSYLTKRPPFPIGTDNSLAPWRFSRTSPRAGLDKRGRYVIAPTGVPLEDFDGFGNRLGVAVFQSRTNTVRNSRLEGFVAPTTVPVTMTAAGRNGVGWEVAANTTEMGLPVVHFRVFGTATAEGYFDLVLETVRPAASSGQFWTTSAFLRLVAGDFPSGSCRIITAEISSGSSNLGETVTSVKEATGAPITQQPFRATRQCTNAGTATVQPYLRFRYAANEVVDFTFAIGLPALELGATPTLHQLPPPGAPQAMATATDVFEMATDGWLDPTGGTIFAEVCLSSPAPDTVGNAVTLFLIATDSSNRLGAVIDERNRTFSLRHIVRGQSAPTGFVQLPAAIPGLTPVKVAFSYRAGWCGMGMVGQSAEVATQYGLSAVNRLTIGGGTNGPLCGWIRSLAYKRRTYSLAELAAITA